MFGVYQKVPGTASAMTRLMFVGLTAVGLGCGERNATSDRGEDGTADASIDGGALDMGETDVGLPYVAAALEFASSGALVSGGWDYHTTAGGSAHIRVRSDGSVLVHPQTACEGFHIPQVGSLNAGELSEFRDLLSAQDDFVELTAVVCPSCSTCGLESLYLGGPEGTQLPATAPVGVNIVAG